MHRGNLLGDFLHACRERISPDVAGIRGLGVRRVAGLRREEVALLAGVSANYYMRLEQGRDKHPSVQVREALARALQLDEAETAYLHTLGEAGPPEADVARPAAVPISIRQLLETLDLPAFVQDEHFDVVRANAMARALSPTLRPGRNRLLSVFLDPDERALFLDWEVASRHLVATFRASVAAKATDRRTTELVNELSVRDDTFRALWASHDVVSRVDRPPVRFDHPQIGVITLTRDNLAIDGPDDMRLMIYHAEPGSSDADRMDRLRDIARGTVRS